MDYAIRLQKAFAQLGIALLNATMMLALILAVVFCMLVARAQDLAAHTQDALREALTPHATQLAQIALNVEQMEVSLREIGTSTTGELSGELEALRQSVDRARADLQGLQEMGSLEVFAQLKQAVYELFVQDVEAQTPD